MRKKPLAWNLIHESSLSSHLKTRPSRPTFQLSVLFLQTMTIGDFKRFTAYCGRAALKFEAKG